MNKMDIKKKKIFWLTAVYFYDVDLPIVPEIAKQHCIDWHIFLDYEKTYNEDEILSTTFPETDQLKVFVNQSKLRDKDPRKLFEFLKLIKKIKKGKYDIVYINLFDLFFLYPLLYLCRVKNVVYACHDVVDHVGESKLSTFVEKKFIFTKFHNFHIFSQEQYNVFMSKHPTKNVLMARLAMKDFGKTEAKPPDDKIVFTYFGVIRENKGVEYLIEAGNKLHEAYHGKYMINIFGYTPEWEQYEKLIKYSESFNFDIRKIDNSEIPEIFCSSHFIVLPYKDVTQSGILSIAHNYCTPPICSDFKGFREYVEDGVNGFLFQPMDSDDLFRKMKYIIEHFEDYSQIKQNLKIFIENNCSINAITDEYLKFFNQPLK